MSKAVKYLSASVPTAEKARKSASSGGRGNQFAALAQRIDALNEQITKQNRDALDAEYNVDEENLSESLLAIIRDLQDRVTALENIVNGE